MTLIILLIIVSRLNDVKNLPPSKVFTTCLLWPLAVITGILEFEFLKHLYSFDGTWKECCAGMSDSQSFGGLLFCIGGLMCAIGIAVNVADWLEAKDAEFENRKMNRYEAEPLPDEFF